MNVNKKIDKIWLIILLFVCSIGCQKEESKKNDKSKRKEEFVIDNSI